MASILVVDDHTAGRQFLATLLGYTGHRVFEAENGGQALEIAHAEHPDLIITDMLMPVMGGYELARQLREERDFNSIAVIFYTASYRESEINSLAKAAGVQYVLSKPAEPQAILDLVNTALGQIPTSGSQSEIITKQLLNPLQVVSEKLTAKMGELEGVNLRLSELIALGMEIGAERNPQRLLEKFCERARKILNAKYAAVRILAKDGESTRYFITSGMDPETVARLGSPPTGEGVPSALLNEHQAIRLRDLTTDPRSVGFPPGHPIMRSFLGVPITTSVQKYGNFYLTEKIGEEEFSEEDERLAVTLALQVAVAYENARLYDDIQSHAAMLQIEISRREQAEDSLMTSEELFRTSFQYSAVGMCITTLDGRLKTVNQALADMLGFTKAELEGKHFNDITHPEDLEIGKDAVGRMISGAVPNVSFEKRYLRKTGEAVWTYVSSSLLRDSSGKPLHFITQILDSTERKRAQEKIERQNQRLKILREIDVAILAADSVENIVNAALSHIRELIECRRVSMVLIGWETNEAVVFDVRADIETTVQKGTRVPLALFQNMLQTLSTNQPLLMNDLNALADPPPQIQGLIREGWQSLGLLPLFSQDNLIGSISLSSEITGFFDEEKIALGREVANQVAIAITQSRLAQRLRESEQTFSTLFAKAPFAIQLTKLPAGDIVEVNKEFEKLVGYSREELIGMTSLELNMYPDPETRARMAAEFHARGFIRNAELAFRTKSGDLRHLLVSTDFLDIRSEKLVLTTAQDVTERRLAEEQLRYQAYLLENVNDAIIASDAEFRLKAWNLAAEEMYGWKAEEVLGRNGVEILQTRFSEADTEEMRRQIAEVGYYVGEATQLRKDGTRIPVELASIVLRDDGGNITDYVSVNRDITERKQAEADLRVENERFQRFVESNIVGIVIADASGKIVTANDYYLNLLDVTRQDFDDGKVDWRKFTPPEWLPADEKAIQELRERGVCEPYEKEYVRADGSRVPVYIADAMLPGPEEQIVAFVLDITERKRAEEELRISEERFSKAFFASPAGLTITRIADGKFIDVNDAFLRMFEFSRAEVIGHTSTELNILSPEERAKLIQAQLESGGLRNAELQARAKSGRIVNILFSSRPMELGGETCHVTTMIDITERKRAEAQIQRQLKHLNALRRIDTAISSSFDLTVILDVVLQQVITELEVDASAILLVNPVMETLQYAASRGFHSDALHYTKLKLGEGYAGRAVLEGKTIRISDLMEAGGKLASVLHLENESFIEYYGSPLIVKGEVKGVLEIYHRSVLEADAQWQDFLETLAGQTAIAIDNVQLFDGLQRSNLELGLAYDATIEGWSKAMDLRDKETEGHTQRVTELTLKLASAMQTDPIELTDMRRGALLHDMGKLGVPDSILLKPGKLTDEEWHVMRKHPEFAYQMLSSIAYLKPALEIPYCHHEKWDGTGYPRGLKAHEIPLAARIFAVVDVWDAVTSDRPYRPAWTEEQALTYIKEQSGSHFDPHVVEVFLRMIRTK